MRPPCESMVKSVLPAFRSLVAKALIEKYNFSQTTAARKLGTTQAAISYYLYSKRGEKKVKDLVIPSFQSAADQLASEIAAHGLSPFEAMLRICDLCKAFRSQGFVCQMHKGLMTVPEACDVCGSH